MGCKLGLPKRVFSGILPQNYPAMLEQHPNFIQEQEPLPKKRVPLRLFFVAFLVFLLVWMGWTRIFGHINTAPNAPDAYDPLTLEPVQPNGLFQRLKHFVFSGESSLEGQRDDRINILIMGMGGPGHDGPFLTDTIMMASIQPSTHQIAMISIPRDLGVKIPSYGWNKINHAYAYGEANNKANGGLLAKKVVEDTFDIPIHYWVAVDFTAFQDIINSIGGVNIDVEQAFTDPLFPAPNDEYQTISFATGVQTMSGERALQFARSRHGSNGEGSDFARAKRQQKVILSLKEKIMSFGTLTNPIRIHSILQTLDKHITTDLEFSNIIAFIKMGRDLSLDHITTLVLDNSVDGFLENATTAEGAFILQPKNGTFDEINKTIANIFEQTDATMSISTPAQDAPIHTPALIEIQNGTWRAGLAARIKKYIEDQGLRVGEIGNTTERPLMQSGIYDISASGAIDVLNTLQNTLHISIKQYPPDGITPTSTTDILVVLGEDFTE